MKPTVLIFLALLASSALAQSAAEETPAAQRRAPAGRHQDRAMKERLGLDSATTARIAAMRDEANKERIELRAKLQSARVDFRAAMRKNPADEKVAKAKQKEMAGYRERLEASRLEHRLAVEKLLTPEQREMFRERSGRRRMDFDHGFDGHRRFDERRRQMRHPKHDRREGDESEPNGDGVEE